MKNIVRCKWLSDGFERPSRSLDIAAVTIAAILQLSPSEIRAMLVSGEKVRTPCAVWWIEA